MRLGAILLGAVFCITSTRPIPAHAGDLAEAVSFIRGTMGADSVPGHAAEKPEAYPVVAILLGPERQAARLSGRALWEVGTSRQAIEGLIEETAVRHQLEPALVKAVVATESAFDPNAVSRVGAQGLMQLMPKTAHRLGVVDPFDPRQNLDGGVRYLKQMLNIFGDIQLALAAYNAGPGAVKRYRGIPPYKETQAYVRRIVARLRAYRDAYR